MIDERLAETLDARARGEVDFCITVASTRQTEWREALDYYPQAFARAAAALLERAEAARERRKARS